MKAAMNRAAAVRPVDRADLRIKKVYGIMHKHRFRPDALIEVLHTVEDAFGYLPLEVMAFVAHELRVPPSRVYGVATFYHFFSLKPKGEHNCLVCTGTACHVRGAQGLLAQIERHLGLRPGETSPDGKLGLQTARCLGCCGLAPAAVLDGEVLARAAPDDIVDRIRQKMGGGR
jgi:bidirectional [NiFe] hydrogenase diaphorase subunit